MFDNRKIVGIFGIKDLSIEIHDFIGSTQEQGN